MAEMKAANAKTAASLLEAFQTACAKARRQQSSVFREYLAHEVAEHKRRGLPAEWPPLEAGFAEALAQNTVEASLYRDVQALYRRTDIRPSEWYRLAMWNAVRNGAKLLGKP